MRDAMVQATREAVRASDGRPIAAGNLHLTLAFLGPVPERRLPELAEAGRRAVETLIFAQEGTSAPGDPLELTFDHLEHWRAARLLCALPSQPPALLAALARELQSLLTGRGFAPDPKPFRPHVTVARNVAGRGPAGKMHPVLWRSGELALVRSRSLTEGALYSVVESYRLGPTQYPCAST